MVVSGKHFPHDKEEKQFFYIIPTAFDTDATIVDKKVVINFKNAIGSKISLHRTLKEQGALARRSKFGSLFEFDENYVKQTLNLENLNVDYTLAKAYQYNNKDFTSTKLKFLAKNSSTRETLYITFDMFIPTVDKVDRDEFLSYFVKLESKQKNQITLLETASEGNQENIPVYSMVISGKHYPNHTDTKKFFWIVPMAFNSNVVTRKGEVEINFPNAKASGISLYRTMINEGEEAKKSRFGSLFNFTDKYYQTLKLDLAQINKDYSIESAYQYNNKDFTSTKIKFKALNSKTQETLYITFDMNNNIVNGKTLAGFLKYFTDKIPKKALAFLEDQ